MGREVKRRTRQRSIDLGICREHTIGAGESNFIINLVKRMNEITIIYAGKMPKSSF
jgi:hypothetical protein